MIVQLLFSISALLFMVIFIVTYFSYKNDISSMRSKTYIFMIFITLMLSLIEIIEGIVYVYQINIIFSLIWKLRFITIDIFIFSLFYYYLLSINDDNAQNFEEVLFDKNLFSIKNILFIIFLTAIILSIIFIKPYSEKINEFNFYTAQSMFYILFIYLIYIIYNFIVVYFKLRKSNLSRNDYIILIGNFIFFALALFFEYSNTNVSVYSTLFTLVLILTYYFKENEDLLMIGKLQKEQYDLYTNNYFKLKYLHELLNDLESPLSTFEIINKDLENCFNLTDDVLIKELDNLNYISNNLVSIANNQTTSIFLKYRIDKLVKNIEKIVEPSFKNKPVSLTINIDPNIPSLLMGDRISIHRIISSLLICSIENTDVGKIILTITGEKQRDNEILYIKVSDTGNGIKEEDYWKVFADDSNNFSINKKSNLALTKKYVEALGGNISFESNYGSGTIFYVTIPQKIVNESTIGQVPMSDDKINVIDCNNKKVLFLNNEEYFSKKLTNIFKKYNITLECINSGLDAINMIKDGKEYDLIIIDESITDIDLIQFGRIIKYLKDLLNIPPLVAISSQFYSENVLYEFNNIYDDYLQKPINLKKLDKIIKKYNNH